MTGALAPAAEVQVRRVPGGGVQPQACVATDGAIHLIYLTGDPAHSDIQYVTSADAGMTWSAPIRVNSRPGSAVAMGTVRGAQLALGRDGSIHVAWMGSSTAEPKAPDGSAAMLYARLPDKRATLEPQRNLIISHPGLDGGGSIAADQNGNVFVAWHAPAVARGSEQDRRVWVARSVDNGNNFTPEIAISDPAAGVCGCCGMRVFISDNQLFALYRSAAHLTDRGMHLVESGFDLAQPRDREFDPMTLGMCIMSTSEFSQSPAGQPWAAWETKGRVYVGKIDGDRVGPSWAPRQRVNCKHPSVAVDRGGNVLLSWTEGTAWNKGGSVAWQVFDPSGKTISGASGHRDDLPAWDAPASICTRDGKWVVLY